MSKIKDFETELALRSLAKALPGHEEAINSTLDKVASLQAREKELEGKYQEVTDWYVKMKTRMLAAEAELARMKAQKPQYQIQKFTETNSRALWVDVSGKQEAENQVVHGYTWRAVYAEPRPAVLPGKDTIREVFMHNGFTIKEGQTDLKDYVYAAASDLLELGYPPQRVVVSDNAFRRGLNALNDCLDDCGDSEQALKLAIMAIQENDGGEIAE